MHVLDELDELFNLFHDGSVTHATRTGDGLRLQVEVGWLVEHLSDSPDCLVLDLFGLTTLAVRALPRASPGDLVKGDTTKLFAYEPEFKVSERLQDHVSVYFQSERYTGCPWEGAYWDLAATGWALHSEQGRALGLDELLRAARLSAWAPDLCTDSVRSHVAVENQGARIGFPEGGPPFTLLLHLVEPWEDEEKDAILDRIVTSACRAVICWGPGSAGWEDDLDHAAVIAELAGNRPSTSTLMTSAHESESPEEVVDFLLASTPAEHKRPLHLRFLTVASRFTAGQEDRERLKRALVRRHGSSVL